MSFYPHPPFPSSQAGFAWASSTRRATILDSHSMQSKSKLRPRIESQSETQLRAPSFEPSASSIQHPASSIQRTASKPHLPRTPDAYTSGGKLNMTLAPHLASPLPGVCSHSASSPHRLVSVSRMRGAWRCETRQPGIRLTFCRTTTSSLTITTTMHSHGSTTPTREQPLTRPLSNEALLTREGSSDQDKRPSNQKSRSRPAARMLPPPQLMAQRRSMLASQHELAKSSMLQEERGKSRRIPLSRIVHLRGRRGLPLPKASEVLARPTSRRGVQPSFLPWRWGFGVVDFVATPLLPLLPHPRHISMVRSTYP
ncbi:hypothetical protein MBM_00321 [Drepanopeziza brunnea f. sp. 'multigermtubi' MB_m1]|uniref:Uncharacterized protein n=1 Tax=Marssonina brunnea f. sp. multigermtubi (strain MB_m1) TaxID=1072389 RepID=K1XKV0_MARBU|nr:uncharacterized protein MBM_00321 [Drepanopeziza brunnea f. sp. 'multigermtubi' MB_m1]EKD21208.1 hypothetical protein MBM_00321 [Drepanopeziza brunnea f. sp. 'multigermtubi' MB_m1]